MGIGHWLYRKVTPMNFPVDPADASIQSLALYYASWCPYCVRVLDTMEQLGLQEQVVLRSVDQDLHDADLRKARGRGTVPVLRIQWGGDDVWMPESEEIRAFLRQRFG